MDPVSEVLPTQQSGLFDLTGICPPPSSPPSSGVFDLKEFSPPSGVFDLKEFSPPSGVFDLAQEEEMLPPPPSPTKEQKDPIEQFFQSQAQLRGWVDPGELPTTNPFLLQILCGLTTNPWQSRTDTRLQTPEQLSGCLESAYMKPRALVTARLFRPKDGDVIVCGCIRSGQTPVLQILAGLRAQATISKTELLKHVSWIESTNSSYQAELENGKRILKTHLSLRAVFGGQILSEKQFKRRFKVVCMLRDPSDIRLSWFRHLRRVYKKFNDVAKFDQTYTTEQFAGIKLYNTDANKSSMFEHDRDYEDFVFETLSGANALQNPTRILVCFYEELLVNPHEFVKRIAQFMHKDEDLDYDLLDRISQSLLNSPDFPKGFFASKHSRVGSSGKARLQFSPKSLMLQHQEWRTRQSLFNSPYSSYEELVTAMSSIVQRPITTFITGNSTASSGKRSTLVGRFTVTLRKRTGTMFKTRTSSEEPAVIITPRGSEDYGNSEESSPVSSPKPSGITLPFALFNEELASQMSMDLLFGKEKESLPSKSLMRRMTFATRRETEEEVDEEISIFEQTPKNIRRITEAAARFKPPRADPDDSDHDDEY
ncbi:hypothetical protein BASA81_003697 [Batrachochytrium salamandrivorans]|nr:hypothetical protein BASA81_003697 [Batrachochytrium salamandrivorans]